jgi:hypothetical protein
MLPDLHFDCLGDIDVEVKGSWCEGRRRDWRGVASALEPLVAVTFVASSDGAEWCKSKRPQPSGQPIRLLLAHYDADGTDVQVNFSVGESGRRLRTEVKSADYRPATASPVVGRTGRMLRFADIVGSRRVSLGILFVARSHVRIGRNGLWRVRPEVAERLPEPIAYLMTHSRTGRVIAG